MSKHDEYHHWPFLTPEEFELACAFFDQRYVRARLGPTRQLFKLRLRRALIDGTSYIEILRVLQLPDHDDDLSLALEKLTNHEVSLSNTEMKVEMETEDDDHEALRPNGSNSSSGVSFSGDPPGYSLFSHQPYVIYEIHLHPTYNVPTLWFTLHDLPMGEPTFDLNSVYRYLVPEEYKSQLRGVGVTGGISAAPHPLTDVPAFFIHPCQTKEAMEKFKCSIDDYLMLWLGLVGGCVGLWVPHEMAESHEETP